MWLDHHQVRRVLGVLIPNYAIEIEQSKRSIIQNYVTIAIQSTISKLEHTVCQIIISSLLVALMCINCSSEHHKPLNLIVSLRYDVSITCII